jgi:transcriptional regulator with XRE-family HTH domain
MAKKGILTLREIRKAKDMSLDDVSRAGGPKMTTYAKLDSGKASLDNMALDTFIRICYAYQMDPNTLLTTLGINWQERRE